MCAATGVGVAVMVGVGVTVAVLVDVFVGTTVGVGVGTARKVMRSCTTTLPLPPAGRPSRGEVTVTMIASVSGAIAVGTLSSTEKEKRLTPSTIWLKVCVSCKLKLLRPSNRARDP